MDPRTAWQFRFDGAPTLLHGSGERLFLKTERPYASYDMEQYGETRVGPAGDALGWAVGKPLVDGSIVILRLDDLPPTCAGVFLRLPSHTLVIGDLADNLIVAGDVRPEDLSPYWSLASI